MSAERRTRRPPVSPRLLQGSLLGMAGLAAVALTVAPPRTPPAYTPDAQRLGATVGMVGGSGLDDVLPGVGATATPSGTVEASPVPSTSPEAGASASPSASASVAATTAVVIGDGLSATPKAASSFGCTAVVAMGWRCENVAVSGAGYTVTGSGAFAAQVARVSQPATVGLVVVSGGVNDRRATAAAAEQGVTSLVSSLRETFPAAAIVLVGPFPGSGSTPATKALASTLKSAAQGQPGQAGSVQYVASTAWFSGTAPLYTPDGAAFTPQARAAATAGLKAVVPAPVA